MDKFGILKLLNSFYEFYGKNLRDNSQNNSNTSSEKPDNFTPEVSKKEKPSLISPPHPLQNGMVSTMKSHDELVKRVMQKQNKN